MLIITSVWCTRITHLLAQKQCISRIMFRFRDDVRAILSLLYFVPFCSISPQGMANCPRTGQTVRSAHCSRRRPAGHLLHVSPLIGSTSLTPSIPAVTSFSPSLPRPLRSPLGRCDNFMCATRPIALLPISEIRGRRRCQSYQRNEWATRYFRRVYLQHTRGTPAMEPCTRRLIS